MTLSPEDFPAFFQGLHGKSPFPWQSALAKEVCQSGWPAVIDLPTASGKTACLDIAVFALACMPLHHAPRRIFFVVDRKVIVDEAFERMSRIARRLAESDPATPAGTVANRLRAIAGDPSGRPLDVYHLRGGIYRDESWVRTPLQPTVITSTVDQIGSRLLFRGYGVSSTAQPIHAALIANDALIFLDEAHCSRAFAQTLDQIQRYRGPNWAPSPVNASFAFVEMTATPTRKVALPPFTLTQDDRDPKYVLRQRLTAPKPTRLVPVKAKSDNPGALAAAIVAETLRLAQENSSARRVLVMVNRVATALAVFQQLSPGRRAELVTGRMRPVDRADVIERLSPLRSERRDADWQGPAMFVISTQCLEVGADLDFDLLVTECASIDALLQRFGRLDRLGKFLSSNASIILTADDNARPDPVYGSALSATRSWLESVKDPATGLLNFGIESSSHPLKTIRELLQEIPETARAAMMSPAPEAPRLLPAHLDAFVQTSPKPVPDPDVSLFLHGLQPSDADVQVVWRKDLDELVSTPNTWLSVVSLCPPVSAEALPVRLWTFRQWLTSGSVATQSDIEGGPLADAELAQRPEKSSLQRKPVLIWRGEQSVLVTESLHLRPGDTIVMPCLYGGADALGFVPNAGENGIPADLADRAFLASRSRVRLRLHTSLLASWPDSESFQPFLQLVRDPNAEWGELKDALVEYLGAVPPDSFPPWLHTSLSEVVRAGDRYLQRIPYPVADSGFSGWVLSSSRLLSPSHDWRPQEDGDADEKSVSASPVKLSKHTEDVCRAVAANAANLLDPVLQEAIVLAARWHDAGKVDSRFQTLLHGGDALAAAFSPFPLAKGRFYPPSVRSTHFERSNLPKGFRHELLSLLLASATFPDSFPDRQLVLHLIATHHGRCRPFAPVVLDSSPQSLSFSDAHISAADLQAIAPAHHLASGVPERFWNLTRRFGWWGLSYLEAILRLSDWQASEAEQLNPALPAARHEELHEA